MLLTFPIWPRQTLLLAVLVFLVQRDLPAQTATPFETSVAPVLVKRCVGCHNPSDRKGGLDLTRAESAMTGGESGRVIEPGKPDESLLWQYIESGEMPPKQPLSEPERLVLRHWIESGATWTGPALDPFRYTTESRAGYDWWSLQPPTAPNIPAAESRWTKNPIDHFVWEKLGQNNLQPNDEADRRVLIRRVFVGLTGLLPTPEEVREFEADDSLLAYEQLIERLLASPAYGERWARHWLDVARFGESQGFERDKMRTNSWRYRDWVIDAFNNDLPYDRFAHLQLAGDAIEPANASNIFATGFLVAGPYDEVGHKQQSEAMRAVVREDELEDIVSTVGQTFLGLTVNCSRCHDHKFDPVRQAEYYAMCAALAGVRHGEREFSKASLAEKASAAMAGIRHRLHELEAKVDEIEAPVRERILAERKQRAKETTPPRPLAQWEFDGDAKDSFGILHAQLYAGAKIVDGCLVLDGRGFAGTVETISDLREKTLEAWVSLSDLKQQGGGVICAQTSDGILFDAIVYGEQDPGQWMAGSNYFERTQSFHGSEEVDAKSQFVHIAIAWHKDGTIAAYRNGQPYGSPYKSNGPVVLPAGKSQILFGLRHTPPGGNRFLRGKIDRARLYNRALSDAEVAASAGSSHLAVSEKELLPQLSESERARRETLQFEITHLRDQLDRWRETKAYAVTPENPPETYLLIRGNPSQKGDVVHAGGIAALRGLNADFGLGSDSSDRDRRLQLAYWIANEKNPLFARVMVNRLWHYHFGVGLVETPNDFGFNGGRPSHPELLDWLACEFMRSGWSIKHMQRLILTSATYRQSSTLKQDAAKLDADNRLLWRKSPMRLEAEAVRDIVLQVAGELNTDMFGPGYHDFTTFTHNSQFYVMGDPVGMSFQRRSLYRTWLRSGRSPFLDVFDCPDPSTKTPQRAVTTTPLQALSLLNNSFILRHAGRFAERIEKLSGPEPDRQVEVAFQLAFARESADDERITCIDLVRNHGLSALARVIFNSNEFLYID